MKKIYLRLLAAGIIFSATDPSSWAEEASGPAEQVTTPPPVTPEKQTGEPTPDHLRSRWNRHVLAVGFDYFLTLGQVQPFLPSATGASLAYRFEADDVLGQNYAQLNKRNWLFPALRAEGRYLNFSERTYSERILGFAAGAEWLFPLYYAEPVFVTAAILPGISRAEVSSPAEIRRGIVWSWQIQSGFEYHLGKFGLFLHYRYLWFADTKFPLHGWGGTLGLIYRL